MSSSPTTGPSPLPPIVDVDWIRTRRDELTFCHVGTTMTGGEPHAAYLDERIPGARYLSLDDDLAAPAASPESGGGRHPLPDPATFAAALRREGIATDARVVAYDRGNGAMAARLVWMLRILGRDAALLDGSLGAWPSDEREHGPVQSPDRAVDVPAVPWPTGALADADEVAAHVDRGGLVVDSREAARYRGEVEPIDAVAGHVPGAIGSFFGDNLVDGRMRPPEELAERFAALRDDPSAIVYCGSGVTACHNALAIEHAGLPRPRVYVGSWSGWSSSGRPVATG